MTQPTTTTTYTTNQEQQIINAIGTIMSLVEQALAVSKLMQNQLDEMLERIEALERDKKHDD